MKLAIEPQEHTNTRGPRMLQQVITRNRSFVLVAAILGHVVSLHGETRGDVIFIANSSFEGPAFGSGGFGSATAWAEIGAGGGAFRPVMPGLIVNSLPDGFQVGYAGNTATPGSLFQDLGVSIVAGANYELELFVGSRNDGFNANYLVELLAGSTTVASTSGTILNTGNFIPVNLTKRGIQCR